MLFVCLFITLAQVRLNNKQPRRVRKIRVKGSTEGFSIGKKTNPLLPIYLKILLMLNRLLVRKHQFFFFRQLLDSDQTPVISHQIAKIKDHRIFYFPLTGYLTEKFQVIILTSASMCTIRRRYLNFIILYINFFKF